MTNEPCTYEVWTAIDFATNYPTMPAFGLRESFEVISKCCENFVRELGVMAIYQLDSTKIIKGVEKWNRLADMLGFTQVHPKMLDVGKGNSQANGLIENLHSQYDRWSRELATYQGKGMDSLTLKRVKVLTQKMVKATDTVERAKLKAEAERMGRGIVFDSFEEAKAWFLAKIEKRRDTPNSGLPKIADPETGKQRHMTPRERLNQCLADGWEPILLSAAELIDTFRQHVMVTVVRGGVTPYSSMRFDHADLEHWNGKKVLVAVDIMDYSKVWVKDLTGRLICEARFLESRLPRPLTAYEFAEEKRLGARVKRKENQIAADVERTRAVVIEAPADVIDINAFLAPSAEEIAAAALRRADKPMSHSDTIDWLYGEGSGSENRDMATAG